MMSCWYNAILSATQKVILLKSCTFVKSAEKPLTVHISYVISSKTVYKVLPLVSTAIEIQQ